MSSLKIHILFNFKEGPWGGGNQFLKALKSEFIRKRVYKNDPRKADCYLFNSHHHLRDVLKLKLKHPHKIFIHRVDGPIFLIRKKDLKLDRLIFRFSKTIADITIFQSKWSFNQCQRLGFHIKRSSVIYNGSDPKIFNRENKKHFGVDRKIKLIATSWSSNWGKGFNIYSYLDENLDFNKYDFIFVGNSPMKFKNIKHINPLPSIELAKELKKADIFITASEKDPCSNSLIEAMNCGLPVLVLEDGGHPELVGRCGETFRTKEEIFLKLKKIIANYSQYQSNITNYEISEIAGQYMDAIEALVKNNEFVPKKISYIKYYIRMLQLGLSRS